ncbi:hypothetical protein LAV73_23405 [Lysinibacillus xylanilyticus]|uniref:hypothetical protein n=1 Tax=Lysinibacillus xylanilyticus TaxID=582475 RepID=UPI002B243E57|nr:hypothetical protein [Lysinibacillus xylanilyticus]MEB2282869.1 hypothetical protein [Lysinibacillus xylanilyticus]
MKLRGKIPNFDEIVCTNGTINVEDISLGIFIGSIKKYRAIDFNSTLDAQRNAQPKWKSTLRYADEFSIYRMKKFEDSKEKMT